MFPSIHSPSVLIVDDEAENCAFTKLFIGQVGIAAPVLTLDRGEKAIDYLISRLEQGSPPPAVMLLDVKMQSMSGFEVLEWVRATDMFDQMHIVMWSASNDEKQLRDARELGADAYMHKFPHRAVFGALLRECLRAPRSPEHETAEQPETGRHRIAYQWSPHPMGMQTWFNAAQIERFGYSKTACA